jgi:energy-coupling factor transport system permease protein
VAPSSVLSTRLLLTCAAIGVATGLLGAGAGYASAIVVTAAPWAYGLVLGSHVLPGVISQELLRRPWVAIITHLLAALVASAFAPQWIGRYLGTALLIGGLQEGVAALTRYRVWSRWRFFLSAAVVAVALAIGMGFALNASSFGLAGTIVFYALTAVGPFVWTAIGIAIGQGLRRAGVARTAQRPIATARTPRPGAATESVRVEAAPAASTPPSDDPAPHDANGPAQH